jgi:hypothetical protein
VKAMKALPDIDFSEIEFEGVYLLPGRSFFFWLSTVCRQR